MIDKTVTEEESEASLGWWQTAADLELTVSCEGGFHRLLWSRGSLDLTDHPELDAELAMVALGGPEPRCLELLKLWDEAVADGGFLGEWIDETRLSDQWFSWLHMALERMRSEGFHEFLRRLPPARAQRMGEFLHDFPVPWIDRAAATVSQRVADGSGVACELAPHLLLDGVAQRVRRAFVDAVGGRELAVGAAALVPLSISVGADPSVGGTLTGPNRGVSLAVPSSWLHEVWAAGAAVVNGRLTLALHHSGPNTAELTSVRWDSEDRVDPATGTAPPSDRCTPVLEQRTARYEHGRWS